MEATGMGRAVLDGEDRDYEGVCSRRDELKEWARTLGMYVDDVRVFLDNGFRFETIPLKNDFSRRQMLAYLKKNGGPPPRWVRVSGLWPESRGGLVVSAESRRKRVRALYKATMLLVRRALARHEADPDKAERSVFWDPVVEICRELEIAPSKLSALLKEFSGHSLTQVIDNVRAETVRRQLRVTIRQFVKVWVAQTGPRGVKHEAETTDPQTGEITTHGATSGTVSDDWAVWTALKASRKWPEFSQNSWAQGMGYASYRRLYRACVSVYAKTPHQLEMELIREVLAEGESSEVNDTPDFTVWAMQELETAIAGIPEYSDG